MADITNLTDEQKYELVAKTETGPYSDPFIRTLVKPKRVPHVANKSRPYARKHTGSSTAYGPLQVTHGLAQSLANLPEFTNKLDQQEKEYLGRFLEQGVKFKKYGAEDKRQFSPEELKEYDRYQYGGSGHLTSPEDRDLYKRVFSKALTHEVERAKVTDTTQLANMWHGKEKGASSTSQNKKLKTYVDRLDVNIGSLTPAPQEPDTDIQTGGSRSAVSLANQETKESALGNLQQEQALDNLINTPEGTGDINPALMPLIDASRKELIEQGEQVAETTPAQVPTQVAAQDDGWVDAPEEDNEGWVDAPAGEDDGWVDATEESKPDYGYGETAGLHLTQGATFGMGENLSGFSYAVGQALDPTNSHKSFGEAFDTGKEVAREMNRESAEANPKTAMTSDIAGGLATSFALPGSGLMKAAGVSSKFGAAVGAGAVEGAVAGLGYSEDGEEIKGTLQGMALGGGLSAGFAGIGKAYRSIAVNKTGKIRQDQLNSMASELDANPMLTGDEGGSLAERAERKAHRSGPNDDILWGATDESVDLEKLMLGDSYDEFSMQINRSNPITEEGRVPASESLRINNTRDAYKQGRSFDEELAKVKQENASIVSDLDATNAGVDMVEEAVPATVKTEANVSEEMSMAIFRTDMLNYMRFVTSPKERAKNIDLARVYSTPKTTSVKETRRLIKSFKEAQRAGLADEKAFAVYKQHQYLMESATEVRGQWLRKRKLELRGKGFRKKEVSKAAEAEFETALAGDISRGKRMFYETNMMFREIDRNSNLDLELLQNKMYKQGQKRTTWEASHYSNVRILNKALRKISGKYSKADIFNIMRRADTEGWAAVPSDAKEAVTAITKMTDGLLTSSRESGLDIADKGIFYISRRKKRGAEFVKSMEDFYSANIKGKRGEVNDLIRQSTKIDEKVLGTMSPEQQEMIGFISEMRKHVKGKLTLESIDSHFRTGVFHKKEKMGALLESDTGALHSRKDGLPDFLIDKDIGRSLTSNITEAGNLIFMEPVGRQLDGRAQLLKAMNKPNSAEAVINYRKDNTGQFRKGYLRGDNAWKEKLKLKYGIERVQAVDDIVNLMANAIYPNMVGLNPASWVRNLTQPLTKTLPEMGYWNPVEITKAYGRALKQVTTNRAELKARGIISSDTGAMISEMGADTAVSGSLGMDFVNGFNKYSMSIFNLTDELNRAVTAELSDVITAGIRKKGPKALNQVKHFPPALRDQALRVMRGHNVPGFDDAVRSHFAVQTQLAYGKVGNSEFVRDNGRLLSMMTKWPVAIGTDVHMTLSRKEFSRFAIKYMGPLILATRGASMIKPEEGESGEWRELFFGKQYGANWTPLSSISNLNVTSPIISGVLNTAGGTGQWVDGLISGDVEAARAGAKKVKGGVQQFIPVVGGAWRTYDRVQNAFRQDLGRSDDWLLPEGFEYD